MKKITLLFCCSILSLSINAQDVLWEKSYGGLHGDYLFDMQPTADFGFILAGSSVSDKGGNKQDKNIGNLDYWIWKMDENGALDWQKSFGGDKIDLLKKIVTTRDGGFLLAGSSKSSESDFKNDSNRGEHDFWVIKLNADGSEQWQKTFGDLGSEMLTTAMEHPEGGYIVAGSSSSPEGEHKKTTHFGNKDYWILKLDASGELEWEQSYGGQYFDEVKDIAITAKGKMYVLGYSNSSESLSKTTKNLGNGDFWLLHLDKKGNSLWQKSFGGDKDDSPTSILLTKEETVLLGGASATKSGAMKQSSNKKGTDIWLLHLDSDGGIIWEKTYDIGVYDCLSSMVQNKDGSLLLGAFAKSETIGRKKTDSKGINDYVAIKIDPKGKEKWRQVVGSDGDDVLQDVVRSRDGGYILAGTSNGKVSGERNSKQGRNDYWVVKLRDKENEEDSDGVAFAEAFPNPTSRFTNIIITEEFEKGTATLYDISGKQLSTYTLTSQTLPIDLRNLPVGVYLVNITTDLGSDTVKIIKKD